MHNDIEDRLRQAARRLHTTTFESSEPKSSAPPIAHGSARSPALSKLHVAKRTRPKLIMVAAIGVLLGTSLYMYNLLVQPHSIFSDISQSLPFGTQHTAAPKLPSTIISQISDFVPYFFHDAVPQNFTFNEKDVSYSAGVLFFQVHDQAGNAIVVSEQALPNDFANSKPKGDRTVSDVDGNGAISNREGRTIGTLITSKSPRTLISLNASETVNAGSIEALMIKLVPLSNNH